MTIHHSSYSITTEVQDRLRNIAHLGRRTQSSIMNFALANFFAHHTDQELVDILHEEEVPLRGVQGQPKRVGEK